MFRFAACLTSAAFLLVAAAPARHERVGERSLQLGGTPLELLGARGSLWVLSCDRGCRGEARRAWGRIVRVDPRTGGMLASATLPRPGAIAVGARGVYATDFWRDTIRRLDLRTLGVVRKLKLMLPFRFTPRDNAFLPEAVAVGRRAVWIATERGVVARTDRQLSRLVATVRLPFDAFGGVAVGARAVWLAESLAGVYRIDPRTNRVVARIHVPLSAGRFDAERVVPAAGKVLVVGGTTSANVLTNRNRLARIDPLRNRVDAVTPLPSGPLAVTFGEGSLWVAPFGSSTVDRVDPRTGKLVARFRGEIGTALAVAGGNLWTAFPNGTLRQLGVIALAPWAHPLAFRALPGWRTGASGTVRSAYIGHRKWIGVPKESTAWMARNVRYRSPATEDPPNGTLAHLPRNGVIVWAVIFQGWPRGQKPIQLDLRRARHLPCCEGESVAGGVSELTGAGPHRAYSVIVRVYFGSPPTRALRAQAQHALDRLQLPPPS
jgi:hypothetical protein